MQPLHNVNLPSYAPTAAVMQGGAVQAAHLDMQDTLITRCTAGISRGSNGGGVFISENGSFNGTNLHISNCTGNLKGLIYHTCRRVSWGVERAIRL
jgi:hypothetical protein